MMNLVNNATGEVICTERPLYGGTGQIREPAYNEPGFIAQPPCLWGEGHGLDPPPDLDGLTMHVVKISNATYGHHGYNVDLGRGVGSLSCFMLQVRWRMSKCIIFETLNLVLIERDVQ